MAKYQFKTTPRKHQVKALKKIVKTKGVCALLMSPGTGKTKPVIDYLGMLWTKYGYVDALIAAPLSALDTWQDEFKKHLPDHIPLEIILLDEGKILDKAEFISNLGDNDDRIRAIVVNHDAFKYRHNVPGLKTVTVQDRIIRAVTDKWSPDIVIVDESHRLKTHTSNLSRAFNRIGRRVFRRIIMTGTVAPRDLLDIYGQWRFLNPSVLPDRWTDFKFWIALWGGWEGKQIIGYIEPAVKELKNILARNSFVATKKVLQLPPVQDIAVNVHLTYKEEGYYKEMGKELMIDLPSGAQSISPNVLTKMLRLRQITSGFVGYKDEDDHTQVEMLGESKLKYCIDKVETLVDAGEKVVIFAHFRPDIARIAKAMTKKFKKMKVPVYEVTGDTPKDERKRQRKAFQADEGAAIFVAQMRTMSLAINEFTCAAYGIYYSYSERRDDYEQSRDRLDRDGQTRPVTFYHLIVPNSIDDAMLQSHREKKKLESVLLSRSKEILTLDKEENNG